MDKPAEFYDAVAIVLTKTKRLSQSDSLRASATAHYLAGEFVFAVREFEQLAAAVPDDPRTWSDLAASRIESAMSAQASSEIIRALVAVDRSLAIDHGLSAALFNRADILERMHLWRHARNAWHRALLAETDPVWHDRVLSRLRRVSHQIDDTFDTNKPIDPRAAHHLVNRFPQEVRRYVEGGLGVAWAAAMSKGDLRTADEKLRLARALSEALRDRSHETLGLESIAAMERNDPAALGGYAAYARGRAHLARHEYGAAESALEEAAILFRRSKSPMAQVARYYATTAILEANRIDEAASRYVALLQEEQTAAGHCGLKAQIAWHTARLEGTRGRWDAALQSARLAADGFRSLGEKQSTGFMENMQAELYDYLGHTERAWAHRLAAFDLLSRGGSSNQLQVALGAASRERILRRDWPGAVALLNIEIEESRRQNDIELLVDALGRRARVHIAQGDVAAAQHDVDSARMAVLNLFDRQARARSVATIDLTQGIVERGRNATNSLRLLTSAIEFHRTTSRANLLPELYLERGRSQLASGSERDAIADFIRGIEQLEAQRAALTDFALRHTTTDVGNDLFVEAIRVAVRRGDASLAWQLSERSRGGIAGHVPEGTCIVEIFELPEKLIVFTVDSQLHVKEIPIRREELERLIDSFVGKITGNAPATEIMEVSAKLYDQLLRPGAPGASTLVFISSGSLERMPWAALYDRERQRFLIEDFEIALASALTQRGPTEKRQPVVSRALIVANPATSWSTLGLPPLRRVEIEARIIASRYTTHSVLMADKATLANFKRAIPECDVVHFAGHAVSSVISLDQSFLVLAPDSAIGDSGLLYARDIAKLDLRGVALVVLAACGTIRGPIVRLGGAPTVARAFVAAGAQSVIGTLWDVDDDRSAALFGVIHREVAAGVPVSRALRSAQLQALRSSDASLSQLKNWAGLTLLTTGAAVAPPRRMSRIVDNTNRPAQPEPGESEAANIPSVREEAGKHVPGGREAVEQARDEERKRQTGQ